ncbi:hypothetical protein N7447_009396 [Penicillium robsamsonii]|uniref:uncharacterized protein n=1 Tax=Penicillium robsamsonii TaxID=1792511 RepID=UPI0025493AE2|nr:uncharacterized protein N7447_009396 [Penicillium robsamsonii]KAJ5817163.1 hypothetical protein N7447_009396 [Penicillium robsamsonii]
MTSRHSYVTSPHSTSLSEIIKLEPEKEPWCAGYAPSQGRRCHARTNARGRSSAIALLNEGTKDLRAGRNIDILLEDLAPHTLCTRFHQNQASDLTRRWKRQVRTYLDSQMASTRSSRPVRIPSRRVYPDPVEADTEKRTILLYRTLRDLLQEEVSRLEVARYGLAITADPPTRRESRSTSAASSRSATHTSNRNSPPQSLVGRTVERRSTESTNQAPIPVPRPVRVQVSPQAREVSVSTPRPASPPAEAPVSSNTDNPHSQNETSEANRREVEGECGICLCDMHISEQDAGSDEEEPEHSGDDDHVDDDHVDDDHVDDDHVDDDQDGEEPDEEREAEAENEPQDQELTWCKARCGVNFHKLCIYQWLETNQTPTCPTCRSNWKH